MKKKIILYTLLILSLLSTPCTVQGQKAGSTWPVQVSAVLVPPHSLYLSDYGYPDGGREFLFLTLLNRDLQEGQIDVRLRVSIKAGSMLSLETRAHQPMPVFRLYSGTPLKVSPDDLAPYFRPENLSVSGAFNGRFPEGMIEICYTYVGKIRDDVEKYIVFDVFYFYYNVNKNKASNFCVTTNRLNLKYLKRYENDSN